MSEVSVGKVVGVNIVASHTHSPGQPCNDHCELANDKDELADIIWEAFFGKSRRGRITKSAGEALNEIHDAVTDLIQIEKQKAKQDLANELKKWVKENEYVADDLGGGKAIDSYDLNAFLDELTGEEK